MALQRRWRPVSHYSTSRGSVRLIVVHTTEGSQDLDSLYNWFKNPAAKVSSHVACDNKRRGLIDEYVKRHHTAWTQGNYNGVCVSIEQCTPAGAANGWSRDYWLNHQGWLLETTAAWIAEEAKAYGIPIVKLNQGQAQGGSRGVCGHVDLDPATRTDPGRGFPWDWVIAKAKGQAPSTPAPPSGGGGGTQAPKFSATPYFGQDRNQRHADVRTWQSKMRSRGWAIDVDQIFGPGSERVCRQFQQEKRLTVDGKVGPQTWSTTWTSPVS